MPGWQRAGTCNVTTHQTLSVFIKHILQEVRSPEMSELFKISVHLIEHKNKVLLPFFETPYISL